MRRTDFENAIDAIGCELLGILYRYDTGDKVNFAFGQVPGTLTYIMWDENGRAFAYAQNEGAEDCVSGYNIAKLPYERDAKFDLKFD